MKKTSRRKFGKQLTGALAALPVAAVVFEENTLAQKDQQKTPLTRTAPERIKTSHNTPPDILIGEGSLFIERKGEYAQNDVVTDPSGTANRRKRHHLRASSPRNKIFPGHIKIVDGNGEILYRNDSARNCIIGLAVQDQDGNLSTVNAGASPIVGGTQTLVIDTDIDKGLERTNEIRADPNRKRDFRFRFRHGNREFSIVEVKITELNQVLYRVAMATLASTGEDLRIMLWTEQTN